MAGARKPLPSPDLDIQIQIDLLTRPEKNPTNYQPLVDADTHPFKPGAAAWSRTNAWWLAEASWLSYWHDEQQLKTVWAQRTGMECTLLSKGGTECAVSWNKDFAIVAFRGTQPNDWPDIFSDSRYIPVKWGEFYVHHGFLEAFNAILGAVDAQLKSLPQGCRIWFTGHSLGAALATLAAFHYRGIAAGAYTFGSPLIGTQTFAGEFNSTFGNRSLRYVNGVDAVTRVPPEECAFPRRFTHVDQQRWIDPDGHVGGTSPISRFYTSIFGDPEFMLRLIQHLDTLGIRRLPNTLRDHTPLHYVIHTWNDLVEHP